MCDNDLLYSLVNNDKIIEVGARPKETDKPNESPKLEACKKILKEKLKTTVDLAELAGSGIARKKDAEAKKIFAEGVKAVEEAKKIAAEKEIKAEEWKLDKTAKENLIIDDIFREGQNPVAQQLKLTNYLRSNPDIVEAISDIQDFIDYLSRNKGFIAQVTDKQLGSGTNDPSDDLPEAEPEEPEDTE